MDPRKKVLRPIQLTESRKMSGLSGLMPLINTPFEPGTCRQVIDQIPQGPQRDIAMAEYYYFSGQPEKAREITESYLTCPDAVFRLSACLIYAYSCLSLGRIQHARYALSEIRSTLTSGGQETPVLRAAEAFIAFAASVLLHLPLPEEMPPAREFLALLPTGLRAFALYVQAHYLYLREEYDRSIGLVEATLAMGAQQYPIPAIYLHLVAVMDYMSLKQRAKAEEHLLAAWELARPDDLIEGLGEHHGLLGGMLEAVIQPQWPEEFDRIIEITYRFSAGWRSVHNPITGHDVANDLTTTEFAMAMLAVRGWTNQEIAQHLGLPASAVKRSMSQVMKKLGVSNRRDMKRFMLQ